MGLQTSGSITTGRILVVDDDPGARDFIVASLRADGHDVDAHEVPTRVNPLGAKGVGEAGTVGALPALMNAVNDALAPLGVRHLDMPVTPERVWQAIRAAGRAR